MPTEPKMSDRPEVRLSNADIEHLFSYHAPSKEALPRHAAIDRAAKSFARAIRKNVPLCADRTLAMQSLKRLRMECNAGIALTLSK